MLQSLKLSFSRFLNYLKIFAHSKYNARSSWMVFGLSSAVIQNYRAKMTRNWPKMAQMEQNIAFMGPNALHHILICNRLHHIVIIQGFLLHLLILGRFMLRFSRKSAFFFKMAIISSFLFGTRAARAQDISGNIDPIDLKFRGMIYQCIPNRLNKIL